MRAGVLLTALALAAVPAAAEEGFAGGYAGAASDEILDPTNPEVTVDESFAQPGAIFPDFTLPGRVGYEAFKARLADEYGLRFAFSWQMLFQHATATLPGAAFDDAVGGFAAAEAIWGVHDRGGPFETNLVARLGWRGPVFDDAQTPAAFGLLDLGANWSNYEYTNWEGGFRVEDLFIEQRIHGERFSFRIGNVGPQAVMNFSRFKDARVSFTASPFAFHDHIPWPTFGFGASFRLRPIEGDDLYVVGTINDMNGDPAARGLDWGTAFDERQFFYGLEVGTFRRRAGGAFDHLHASVFYADERITRNADVLPNEAGWGFRVYGERQVDRWVGFGGYTYNTAEGGGISTTTNAHVVTAGLAYLNPADIRGEAAVGLMYAKPIDGIFGPLVDERDQYGAEVYWRMQVTPNLTVTPGAQFIVNPAFNRDEDFIAIPHLKFRITF